MKSWYTLLFGLLLGGSLLAQQPAQYSMYMLDPMRFNPAYAGLEESLSATATYRQQWASLPGAPVGQRLSVHLPLAFLRSGLGMQVESDQLGARRLTHYGAAYNYQLRIGEGVLSLGVSGQLVQLQLNGADLRTPGGIYDGSGTIIHNDASLPLGTEQTTMVSYGAGLYLKTAWLEAGLSVDHLTEPLATATSFDWQARRVYYGSAQVRWQMGSSITLLPSVWVRSDALQTQVDFSALAQYNGNIFLGASFRGYARPSVDAMAIIGGWQISDKLRLAYAYDIPLSPLRDVNNGSHEISINYNLRQPLGQGRLPGVIYHPRAR